MGEREEGSVVRCRQLEWQLEGGGGGGEEHTGGGDTWKRYMEE